MSNRPQLWPALALLIALHATAAAVPPVKPPRPAFEKAVPTSDAGFEPATARRGQTITWKFAVTLAPEHYTYSANQVEDGVKAFATRFTLPAPGNVVFVGELKEPAYKVKKIPDLDIKELRYLDAKKLVWEQPVVVNPEATPGKGRVTVQVRMVVCDNNGKCLPPQDLVFEMPLTITDEAPVEVEEKYREDLRKALKPAKPAPR